MNLVQHARVTHGGRSGIFVVMEILGQAVKKDGMLAKLSETLRLQKRKQKHQPNELQRALQEQVQREEDKQDRTLKEQLQKQEILMQTTQ